jgi:hypothetical protein
VAADGPHPLLTRLLAQGEYNLRLRHLAPLMEAALRWLADIPSPSARGVKPPADPVPSPEAPRAI